jgi:hypothetical protein
MTIEDCDSLYQATHNGIISETQPYRHPGLLTAISFMEISLPLSQMTVEEKLQLMEVIWEDLSRNPENIPLPAWHGEVLAERERLIAEGKAKFLPLDEFRKNLMENL